MGSAQALAPCRSHGSPDDPRAPQGWAAAPIPSMSARAEAGSVFALQDGLSALAPSRSFCGFSRCTGRRRRKFPRTWCGHRNTKKEKVISFRQQNSWRHTSGKKGPGQNTLNRQTPPQEQLLRTTSLLPLPGQALTAGLPFNVKSHFSHCSCCCCNPVRPRANPMAVLTTHGQEIKQQICFVSVSIPIFPSIFHIDGPSKNEKKKVPCATQTIRCVSFHSQTLGGTQSVVPPLF